MEDSNTSINTSQNILTTRSCNCYGLFVISVCGQHRVLAIN